jgi:sugar phosphate isomerase/epimerase
MRGVTGFGLLTLLFLGLSSSSGRTQEAAQVSSWNRDRLVAWCIVPFDARHRGPAERATMVKSLGLTRVAYDWRDVNVPEFEEEIRQYQQHGIEFFAFWGWHDSIEPLITKYGIHPQIWMMFATPDADTDELRVRLAAEALLPMVEKTRTLKLSLALYNHGGWSGEPRNMVAVCRYLHEHHDARHIGIAYNLHHAHDHIADFEEQLELLGPWLLCLNLNGMNDNAQPKILPVGDGQHDLRLLQAIRDSKYAGPLGIIGHREELDAEVSLRLNLQGLQKTLGQLGAEEARTY